MVIEENLIKGLFKGASRVKLNSKEVKTLFVKWRAVTLLVLKEARVRASIEPRGSRGTKKAPKGQPICSNLGARRTNSPTSISSQLEESL